MPAEALQHMRRRLGTAGVRRDAGHMARSRRARIDAPINPAACFCTEPPRRARIDAPAAGKYNRS